MDREKIVLPSPPGADRPGDRWIELPSVREDDPPRRVRTWKGRRRQLEVIFCVTTLLAVVTIVIALPPSEIIKPGELSRSHAQILASEEAGQQCSACHPQAARSPLGWFLGAGDKHDGVTQSERCMNCHHQTIPRDRALIAHHLPSPVRDRMASKIRPVSATAKSDNDWSLVRLIPDAAVDQNQVVCSSCHREHHGSGANLVAMSNSQCQTCHRERFSSFADSHPEWSDWPYERTGSIAFDHASHQQKHFSAQGARSLAFDCNLCHPAAGAGGPAGSSEPLRVAGYEQSCKLCHDDSIGTLGRKGIAWIEFPVVDRAIASQLEAWSEKATGFSDGQIPPIQELMLRIDPELSAFMRSVPGGQLARLPTKEADAEADRTDAMLKQYAQATAEWLRQLGDGGHDAVLRRLSRAGVSSDPIIPVLRSLPPQMFQTARQRWLIPQPLSKTPPSTKRSGGEDDAEKWIADGYEVSAAVQSTGSESLLPDASRRDSLLGDDSLLSFPSSDNGRNESDSLEDPLLEDPLLEDIHSSITATTSQAGRSLLPERLASAGGWYRDDDRLAIRYLAAGHADPVLRGLIEIFSQLREGDPLKARFFESPAVASCVSCHRESTSSPPKWTAGSASRDRSRLTRFSHRAHRSVSELGDCVHCHRVSRGEKISSVATDFEPLTRTDCAQCHRAGAASERCTTCHRYHAWD